MRCKNCTWGLIRRHKIKALPTSTHESGMYDYFYEHDLKTDDPWDLIYNVVCSYPTPVESELISNILNQYQ